MTKTYRNPQVQKLVESYRKAVADGNIFLAISIKHALWISHKIHVGPDNGIILDALRMATPGQRITKPQ